MPDNGKQKQLSDQTKPIREEQIADIQALAGTLQARCSTAPSA